jgi:hypothetical protein
MLLKKSEHNLWNVLLGGSPCIYAGEGALQRSGKSWTLSTRFSARDSKTQGLKPIFEIERFSAGLKSSFPLLKQGAPTKSILQTFSAASPAVP